MKFFLWLSACVFATFAQSNIIAYQDTVLTALSVDSLKAHQEIWTKKMRAQLSPFASTPCNENCAYGVKLFNNTGVAFNYKQISDDSTQVILKYGYLKGYDNIAKPIFRNITYTVKQEFSVDSGIGKYALYKSPMVFSGLTMLNSGLGLIYSSHNTPAFSTPSIVIDYSLIPLDAMLVCGLFVNNKKINNFCYIFLPLFRISTFLRFGIISNNNKMVASKYKYIY